MSPPNAVATPSAAPRRIDWPALATVLTIHLLAATAFSPWLFSWWGVALAIAGCYVFGTLGINLGYHRLLTHRSFRCAAWLEHLLAVLGVCCLEKTPGHFVATHRAHHQHSDREEDPHSPLGSLFWGHVGWVFVENPSLNSAAAYEKYARDVLRDPFYLGLERNLRWVWVYAAHAALFLIAGFGAGWLVSGSAQEALRLGLSVLVWGVFVRTVLVWHITWSVNSIAHTWGYRNYDTRENSRNNFLVGLISNGEGWHNNHHADQRAAAHGHRWWEIDVTYASIRLLRACGLVWDIVPVTAVREAAAAPLHHLQPRSEPPRKKAAAPHAASHRAPELTPRQESKHP
ncbi:acyl-CoA desaturase [Botrimarina hoheduenensis]|uniref:Fatty acid desaturase n=1 Tax=Botrimarina hoheduenensis TaxID=2528000 RepID=A0A5C5VYB5_9BACT|nr:acyl-CoA desaturase [Botrimarina hoheduenensis]TWT42731.1 Fatty acid desaturase [Botrimarina hoheduenensis]